MKKILFIFALLVGFAVTPAFAKNTPVQTMQDFSVSNPSQTLLVKILSNVRLNKETMLHEGFYVLGQVTDVSNGSFTFVPVKFQNFHNEVFEVSGAYPAKFVQVIEPANAKGTLAKGSKILLDFADIAEQVDTSYGERFKNADSQNGISAIVNKEQLVIYDDSIPQTMKDFPGIKLNSFDNSSNFNIPRRLMIEPERREVNINSLKK